MCRTSPRLVAGAFLMGRRKQSGESTGLHAVDTCQVAWVASAKMDSSSFRTPPPLVPEYTVLPPSASLFLVVLLLMGCVRDADGDGILGPDRCPDAAEDYDGFEDEDGCPEPDNDGDSIPDTADQCPAVPEDPDGVDDQDGCPDQVAKAAPPPQPSLLTNLYVKRGQLSRAGASESEMHVVDTQIIVLLRREILVEAERQLSGGMERWAARGVAQARVATCIIRSVAEFAPDVFNASHQALVDAGQPVDDLPRPSSSSDKPTGTNVTVEQLSQLWHAADQWKRSDFAGAYETLRSAGFCAPH